MTGRTRTRTRIPDQLEPHHVRLLLAVRIQRGWTQARLAGELGVSLSTIANWENGRRDPHPVWLATLRGLLVHERVA